ncbi:MAG: O-antigen ligase family protein, partial [Clostridia bacterium]|nr:O-antigen ligase family protein [Clostridia bacterium]
MVNKATINRVNKIFLIIFLAAHPLFELLNEHFGTGVLEVGGISAPILLKNLMFIVMIALAIIANFKRKATKAFLIYIVLFGVFIVLQYINLSYCEPLTFDGEIKKSLPQIAWSVSKYAIVIGVIYLVYLLNFGYKEFKIVVVSTALVVVLFTLGTNLLGIDYIAYKYGSTEHPAGNILAWFTSDINVNNWRIFTSRGLFSSGNSLSAFFSIMLPLTLYMAWQEKKLVLYGLVVAEILTMLTLGTRVSVYGIFLLAFATLFIVALDAVINKKPISKKNVLSIVAVILVFASFFFVSPFISRIKNGEAFDPNYSDNSDMVSSDDSSDCSSDCSSDSSSDIDNPSDEELLHLDTEGKRKYILKHYPTASIPYKLIYEIYDYEEHTDFWFGLLTKVEYGRRNNARKIKSFIIEDIINTKGGAL